MTRRNSTIAVAALLLIPFLGCNTSPTSPSRSGPGSDLDSVTRFAAAQREMSGSVARLARGRHLSRKASATPIPFTHVRSSSNDTWSDASTEAPG